MKLFPRIFRSRFLVLLVIVVLTASLPGCGHRARPASSLSEKERTTLGKYESIRAALVVDDLRAAKKVAADLGTLLKPKPESPATPLDAPVQDLATAPALDKARAAFQTLSVSMIALVDGVEGYYVMESPSPKGAAWVQSTPKVDNPYLGRPMRDVGAPRR